MVDHHAGARATRHFRRDVAGRHAWRASPARSGSAPSPSRWAWRRADWLWAIVAGATAGSLLESWLGATLEAPGILNNDMLNFINTAAAALATLALAAVLA